ncbi:heparan-alpha-glucosaminide N-acetyltransferase domain-containing protein [Stratiformator vulcanicus]|uniref:Heparan-alpha-glucosaminide N-acetyltransferase catalytic domain-containing protein n=1 Tax=Stratiformator vulcanicus TaxID=2527980 RepID=A0A517R5Z1_9PLAN|nr:heparan-alpha-glucosaminide N-acetyltransferase domain-containing protein [Stratiformator vulcanicus]QDT39282.1 hypothetical protein Pan189_36870 [Stratiformator vulcanicus]
MRYASIDILRALAIFVMVFVHFGENLSGVVMPFAGFGAPLFAFLSGVSYYLWTRGQFSRGKSESEVSKISVRRGLFVFGVGIAFNILVWLPEDTFNWDVLTFIGVGLVVLNFVRRIPKEVIIMMAVASVLISPILRLIIDYNSYWANGYFDPDLTLSDIFIGFGIAGYFPVFPWLAFPLLGYVSSQHLFSREEEAEQSRSQSHYLVATGGLLALTAGLLIQTRPLLPTLVSTNYFGGWTMYPPTIEYICGTIGLTLLLLCVTHRYFDSPTAAENPGHLFAAAKLFSQYAFTVYIVHHLVHVWPMWIYALAVGQEPTYYWMKAMPLWMAMLLAVIFLLFTYLILRRVGQRRTFGVEASMRWVCD